MPLPLKQYHLTVPKYVEQFQQKFNITTFITVLFVADISSTYSICFIASSQYI